MLTKDLLHIGVLSTKETDFKEVRKFGDYEVYLSIPDQNPKRSFNLSMHHIMTLNRGRMLALFEEDVCFSAMDHLDQALSELPADWEMCYLGANIVDGIETYSEHLVKCFGCWTTHGVLYNNCADIADLYDGETMFDEWLRANIHPRGNTYLVRPFMAYQQSHFSTLWQMNADYGEILNISNQKAINAR